MLSSEREPQAIGRSLLGPRSQRVPAGPAVRPFCVCAKEKIAAAPCVLFCVCALRRSAKIQAQRHPASSRPLCEPGLDFAPAQSPGRSTRSLQSLHYRAWSPASLPPQSIIPAARGNGYQTRLAWCTNSNCQSKGSFYTRAKIEILFLEF